MLHLSSPSSTATTRNAVLRGRRPPSSSWTTTTRLFVSTQQNSWRSNPTGNREEPSSSSKDFYVLLQIPRSADRSEIKAAYRKLAKVYHPDANPGRDTTAQFQELNRAYEVLSHPTLKKKYDLFGETGLDLSDEDFVETANYYQQQQQRRNNNNNNKGAYTKASSTSTSSRVYNSRPGSGTTGAQGNNGDFFGSVFNREYNSPFGGATSAGGYGSSYKSSSSNTYGTRARSTTSSSTSSGSTTGSSTTGSSSSTSYGRHAARHNAQAASQEPVRGSDMHFDMQVDAKTAMFGGQKEIRLRYLDICSTCAGHGIKPPRSTPCPACGGSGHEFTPFGGSGGPRRESTCTTCWGSGRHQFVGQVSGHTPCTACNGQGVHTKSRLVTVQIPGNVKDGNNRLRLAGQGEAGRNGGPPGDLYIYFTVVRGTSTTTPPSSSSSPHEVHPRPPPPHQQQQQRHSDNYQAYNGGGGGGGRNNPDHFSVGHPGPQNTAFTSNGVHTNAYEQHKSSSTSNNNNNNNRPATGAASSSPFGDRNNPQHFHVEEGPAFNNNNNNGTPQDNLYDSASNFGTSAFTNNHNHPDRNGYHPAGTDTNANKNVKSTATSNGQGDPRNGQPYSYSYTANNNNKKNGATSAAAAAATANHPDKNGNRAPDSTVQKDATNGSGSSTTKTNLYDSFRSSFGSKNRAAAATANHPDKNGNRAPPNAKKNYNNHGSSTAAATAPHPDKSGNRAPKASTSAFDHRNNNNEGPAQKFYYANETRSDSTDTTSNNNNNNNHHNKNGSFQHPDKNGNQAPKTTTSSIHGPEQPFFYANTTTNTDTNGFSTKTNGVASSQHSSNVKDSVADFNNNKKNSQEHFYFNGTATDRQDFNNKNGAFHNAFSSNNGVKPTRGPDDPFFGAAAAAAARGNVRQTTTPGGVRGGITGSREIIIGDDVMWTKEIDWATANFGGEIVVEFRHLEVCDSCLGGGGELGSPKSICQNCQGQGITAATSSSSPFPSNGAFQPSSTTCLTCRGTGQRMERPCGNCRGDGLIPVVRQIRVEIPPNVEDGNRLYVQGEGNAGPNGGPSGDLYIYLKVVPIIGSGGAGATGSSSSPSP
ncbi:hypothetical protein ACA910_001900 [Epithemia clementina (nom. ined.)]